MALDNLIAAGFNGTLYNGKGTSQWTSAGYPLVTTDSVVPPCTTTEIGTCVAALTAEPTTMAPTNMTIGDAPDDSASSIHSWLMIVLVGLLLVLVYRC